MGKKNKNCWGGSLSFWVVLKTSRSFCSFLNWPKRLLKTVLHCTDGQRSRTQTNCPQALETGEDLLIRSHMVSKKKGLIHVYCYKFFHRAPLEPPLFFPICVETVCVLYGLDIRLSLCVCVCVCVCVCARERAPDSPAGPLSCQSGGPAVCLVSPVISRFSHLAIVSPIFLCFLI